MKDIFQFTHNISISVHHNTINKCQVHMFDQVLLVNIKEVRVIYNVYIRLLAIKTLYEKY